MSARLRPTIAVIAIAVGLFLSSTAGAAAKQHNPGRTLPLGGINIDRIYAGESLATINRDVAAAKTLHAKLVRAELAWAQFEPNGPAQIDPATVEVANQLMKDAAAAHIKVIALLQGTPCWASSAPASLLKTCVPEHPGDAGAWPPREASTFGAFAGWLAKKYGSQLAAIEVWNEPDQANEAYLAGPEKPRHDAELLKAAYPTIKRADSKVKVLAGSLVGSNGKFMKELYKQGIKGYYDGVAVHFYTLVLGSVRRFREVQLENGDHKPLWLDEFGWTSCWPAHKTEQEQGCVTPGVQAQNITNSFKELARAPYVAAMLPYKLRNTPNEEFGVLTEAGKRKPSFSALAKALSSPLGSSLSPITVQLKVNGGHVIASGSAPVGDYMKLYAYKDGRLRYEATFTLNRFNDYRCPLPKVLGTSGLTVRVYQYWLGAGDYTQASI